MRYLNAPTSTKSNPAKAPRGHLRGRPAYLALFREPQLARYRYSEEDLRRVFQSEVLARHTDGAIYLIK